MDETSEVTREVKYVGYTATKKQSWNSNAGSLASEPIFFVTIQPILHSSSFFSFSLIKFIIYGKISYDGNDNSPQHTAAEQTTHMNDEWAPLRTPGAPA